MTRRAFSAISLFLLLASSPAGVHAEATVGLPSSKAEVSDALADLRDRYGIDAVKLESFLLQYAIQAGAVLTTSVAMRGVEEVDGRSYLQVDFATGIVYTPPATRSRAPARIWSDIVDPVLRQFRSMQIAADGIALQVRFRYSDESAKEILREGRQDSIPVDVVSFRILCQDIVDSVRSSATSAQLLARAVVLLNDNVATLLLDEAVVTPGPGAPFTQPRQLQ